MEAEIKALYLRKAADYCASREHCQFEVLKKLREWKLDPESADEILTTLISMGFVDDQRYASAYVRGKRRINGWGRLKIKSGLQQRNISVPCINEALKEIDEEEYLLDLKTQYDSLWQQHARKKSNVSLKVAVLNTLRQRGFEPQLIYPLLES